MCNRDRVEVSVTPLQDPGRILASFHGVKLSGKIQLSTALQIAQVKNLDLYLIR